MNTKSKILLIALAASGASQLLLAQTTTSIAGAIYDPAGAVVAGATVTVTNPATGFTRTTVSNETGNYVVTPLQPGTYDLSVELAGFERFSTVRIVLRVDQIARIDVTLKLGGLESQVEVQAEAPLVNVETSHVGDVVDQARLLELAQG